MRLFSEIAEALAAEGESLRVQYTVVDGRGGYFQNVKRLAEFSDEVVVFTGKKGGVRVTGAHLSIGKYFAGDATVLGDIIKVERME